MSWDWGRLSEVVRRLKLPREHYAVGRIGYGLSRDPASTAGRVEILVTETGWRRLKERGWREAGGGSVLRHPNERDLSARVVALDDVRHQITEVDGVPVLAVEPDPPAPPRAPWRRRLAGATAAVVATIALGTAAYAAAVYSPTTEPEDVVEHLTFRTTEVRATVENSYETGTCSGAKAYDRSPRVKLTLSWVDDGYRVVRDYTACGASVGSPQSIWVTSAGEVASQHPPWVDHIWPGLVTALVPFVCLVWPFADRLRALWWRRRLGRSQPTTR